MTKILTIKDIGEIIKLRGLGYSQKEIGDRLGVTAGTISYQLKRINKIARAEGDDDTFLTHALNTFWSRELMALKLINLRNKPD